MVPFRFGVLPCAGILLLAVHTLPAQGPDIGRNGVFNAAAAIPLVLSGNAIARGALLVVTGVRLGADVEGTSIRLAGPWGSTRLTALSATPTRIEARVPASAPLGPATLTVTSGGGTSRAVPILLVATQFGVFSRNGSGSGPGRIDNLSPSGHRTPNSISQPSSPGQTVVLAGTGLGSAAAPAVFIAGQRAPLISLRKGSSDSADEITVRIPATAPDGCFVPVQVRKAGRFPSNMVTVAIHRGDGPCSPPEAIPFAAWSGSRVGLVAAAHTISRGPSAGVDSTVEEAGARFARLPDVSSLPALFRPPPPGACISQVASANDSIPQASPFLDLLLSGTTDSPLLAGPELAINDGKIQQKIRVVQGAPGVYYSQFPARGPGAAARTLPHFLTPGRLNLSAADGDVGRFQVSLPGPEPFSVTDRVSSVDRAHGVTLRWERLGTDRFTIVSILYADPVTFTMGSCYCVAAPGASSITIPPEVLAYFPAVAPVYGGAQASIAVASWPVQPVSFSAAGLDHGVGIGAFLHTWEVTFR